MNTEELTWKLEGLHTIDTVMRELGVKRQTALNILCKLKKMQYCTVTGGGKQPRIYKITMTKQRPRKQGMFDILNKYNPTFKLSPWYDHQVHGTYTVEDAIIDAIQTRSFRTILATLRLFNHVKNWKKLYRLARERQCWNKVGALYETAKRTFRAKFLPHKYAHPITNKKEYLTEYSRETRDPRFLPIEKKWHVPISFTKGDLSKVHI